MSLPYIGGLIFQLWLMLEYLEHPKFSKQAADFIRRFPGFNDGFNATKNIFEVHFHPTNPMQRIAPGKIHSILKSPNYTIWKLEMAVIGLKSKQWPRVWFAVSGNKVVFLCMHSHIDNYDDNDITREAQSLVSDYF